MYEACTRTFILLCAMRTNLGELKAIVLDGSDSFSSCVLLRKLRQEHVGTVRPAHDECISEQVDLNWVRLLVW